MEQRKRTSQLLTIIGVLGSFIGIVCVAFPFYLLSGVFPASGCGESCSRVQHALTVSNYETAAIVILSISISFLPRILYGRATSKVLKQMNISPNSD